MNKALTVVSEALNLAVECGGELDHEIYVTARNSFEQLTQSVRDVIDAVRGRGGLASPADFEKLVGLLGFPAGGEQSATVPEQASANSEGCGADAQRYEHRRVITLHRSQFYRQQFVIESHEALDDEAIERLAKAIDVEYPCSMMEEIDEQSGFSTEYEVLSSTGCNHIVFSNGEARFTDRPDAPVLELDPV